MKRYNESISNKEVEDMIRYAVKLPDYVADLEDEIAISKDPTKYLWELATVLRGVYLLSEQFDTMMLTSMPKDYEFVDSVDTTDATQYSATNVVYACVDKSTGVEFFVIEKPKGDILGYYKGYEKKIPKLFKY